MQFVGLLLIVNSLVGGAWWIASGRPQMIVVPICVAALGAGTYLMAQEGRGLGTAAGPTLNRAELKELTEETAKAKALLADLQDQTAAADWHLKQLDEHVQTTTILPDGRTRVGNTVMGQPVVLTPKLEALQKMGTNQPAEAFALAKETVGIYEATRDQVKGAVLVTGDVGPELAAWLYTTAATAAQRTGDHDLSLQWARSAVATRPNTERHCLLVTALINKGLQAEADALIQHELKAGGPEATKFRAFLDQYKIPYKRSN
jgi:hypothetical protein